MESQINSASFYAAYQPLAQAVDKIDPSALYTEENHYTVERKGAVLHFWLLGPENGSVVVFNHGIGVDHHMFDEQIASLRNAYRILVWDMRGHGQSESDMLFDLDLAADDLVAILDEIDCNACVLVGVSIGSLVAQKFALQHPERVLGLALLSSQPLQAPRNGWQRFQDSLVLGFLRVLPYWVTVGQAPPLLSVRSSVQTHLTNSLERIGKAQFIASWVAAVRTPPPPSAAQLPEPLLVAHGGYEQIGWIKRAEEIWKTLYPNAQYTVIPGAGHNAPQDNPHFCTNMLRSFVHLCVRNNRRPF